MQSGAKKIVVGFVATVAVVLVVWTAVLIDGLTFSLVENLSLREKPRAESVWHMVETASGMLIRARSGKYAGWYLAADDSVNPISSPAAPFVGLVLPGPPLEPGPYVRNLYLRETRAPDCYWRVSASPQIGMHQIRATCGRYGGWYLDFLDSYTPDAGTDPRTSWNLALNENAVEGSHWRIEGTKGGDWIRAAAGEYSGWYLDYLEDANVFERKRRDEVPRRDAQPPPLLRDGD